MVLADHLQPGDPRHRVAGVLVALQVRRGGEQGHVQAQQVQRHLHDEQQVPEKKNLVRVKPKSVT